EGDGDILTASERGYGKRTPAADDPRKGRGTQGVLAIKPSERNGHLVGATQLSEHLGVVATSDGATLARTRAAALSQVGRHTQRARLIRLAADEKLQAIERLDASLDDDDADADPVEGDVVVDTAMPVDATDTKGDETTIDPQG